MKSKWIVLVVLLVAVFIGAPFVFKKEPTFTGTQYKSDDLTCNLFANPPTFRDKEGRLITGHTIRLHPNGEIYGIMVKYRCPWYGMEESGTRKCAHGIVMVNV
jgi:hypothetical protein